MLSITLQVENDRLISIGPSAQTVAVPVKCVVTEDDPALTSKALSVTVSWGTGENQLLTGAEELNVDESRAMLPGTYFMTVSAENYRHPHPDKVSTSLKVEVLPAQVDPQSEEFLFGPILPRDGGAPNAEQWNFNRGVDLGILESSVKMLLLTTRGERMMQPRYGTNIRRVIFENDLNAIHNTVHEEIVQSLQEFEPRVILESFSMAKSGAREVTLNAVFVSLIGKKSFDLVLNFTR